MKKIIFAIAVATTVIACQKIPEGGNKGRLKLEEGVERYSEDHQNGGAVHSSGESVAASHTTVEIKMNGVTLNGNANGLEDQMVKFLVADGYKNAADDSKLKDAWYNFDHVNFKMGSANQLEAGSQEQLDNLAKILKAYPDAKIKIGGYTDKTGDEATNVKISQERANFIKTELSKLGVGAQILGAEGYGSKFAKVDATASDEQRAADRKMAVRFAK